MSNPEIEADNSGVTGDVEKIKSACAAFAEPLDEFIEMLKMCDAKCKAAYQVWSDTFREINDRQMKKRGIAEQEYDKGNPVPMEEWGKEYDQILDAKLAINSKMEEYNRLRFGR